MRAIALIFLAALLPAGACSGSSGSNVPLPPVPGKATTATLVGPLCKSPTHCECTDKAAKAGAAPAGLKRFQVEVGPTTHAAWVTIDSTTIYKDEQRATDCFYVDLAPGVHPVTIDSNAESGFGLQVTIREIGGPGPSLYRTFHFGCGGPGLCDPATLEDWKRRFAVRGAKQAPCGSTKVQRVGWQTGKMPDNLHPSRVVVSLDLNVYKFAPRFPPGDAACQKK